jgi:hypothetical protein
MTPKPPEGYRLAEPGETYYPKEGGKPAYWWSPNGYWSVWRSNGQYLEISEETYRGYPENLSVFAVPLTAMDELVTLSQELGLYDMTDNPLVKG